jgi:hypothetical protein
MIEIFTKLNAAHCDSALFQFPNLLRGVSPNDYMIYCSNPQNFSCIHEGRQVIYDLSFVNDDYCDCDSGIDEPGTSACYVPGSLFTCSEGSKIFSSEGKIKL